MSGLVDCYNSAFLAANPEIRRNMRREWLSKHEKVYVIAIKPRYAKAIYDGRKQWEFRKVPPPLMKHIYIYESAPVSAITGTVLFGSKVEGFVGEVLEMIHHNRAFVKNLTGISDKDIIEYSGKNKTVSALRCSLVNRFETPVKFKLRPPQNWGSFYVPKD